jgi:hypothetical protein
LLVQDESGFFPTKRCDPCGRLNGFILVRSSRKTQLSFPENHLDKSPHRSPHHRLEPRDPNYLTKLWFFLFNTSFVILVLSIQFIVRNRVSLQPSHNFDHLRFAMSSILCLSTLAFTDEDRVDPIHSIQRALAQVDQDLSQSLAIVQLTAIMAVVVT